MIDNSTPITFELSGGMTALIAYSRQGELKTNLRISISHKNSKILAFSIETSKEFIDKIADTLTNASKVFFSLNAEDAKVKFRVKKGMCKMTARLCPGTKVVTSYPVDDETSFGKITLTMKNLIEIKNELDKF